MHKVRKTMKSSCNNGTDSNVEVEEFTIGEKEKGVGRKKLPHKEKESCIACTVRAKAFRKPLNSLIYFYS